MIQILQLRCRKASFKGDSQKFIRS